MGEQWRELSCGNCGSADMRLQGIRSGAFDAYDDIRAICQGCGCVTHISPWKPMIAIGWGDPKAGEKNDGVLCRMDWPENKSGGS